MTDRRRERGRSAWENVGGGIVVFLVEAAIVVAAIAVASAVAALVLWII